MQLKLLKIHIIKIAMIKKFLLVAALVLPMLASAQTLKIGIVDTTEILSTLPDTKEANDKLVETTQKYEDEYGKLQEEMKRKYDELANMGEDELPAIRERKTRDFQEYQLKIQQFEQNAAEELQKYNQELMAPIIQKIRNAIESVSKEGGFSLVQDNNPQIIFYHEAPVVDITNDVKAKLGIQ